MRIRVKRPSPAFVLAFIALLVALGGTAFAIANNSVGARKLAPIISRYRHAQVQPGKAKSITRTCHAGEVALSADGYWNLGVNPNLPPASAHLVGGPKDPNGAIAEGVNQDNVAQTLYLGVNCLRK